MGYDFFVGWGVIQLEFNWNSMVTRWEEEDCEGGNSVGREVIQW